MDNAEIAHDQRGTRVTLERRLNRPSTRRDLDSGSKN
jgi:hypothetical protein